MEIDHLHAEHTLQVLPESFKERSQHSLKVPEDTEKPQTLADIQTSNFK